MIIYRRKLLFHILFSLRDFPVVFFAHHLIPGYAWFFGVCVDCDVGERSVEASAVPVKYADTFVPNSNLQSLLFWSLETTAVFVLAQPVRLSATSAEKTFIAKKNESDFFM